MSKRETPEVHDVAAGTETKVGEVKLEVRITAGQTRGSGAHGIPWGKKHLVRLQVFNSFVSSQRTALALPQF